MTGLFITGTDTGVGKTLVSTALIHAYARMGHRVVGMKPVAPGAELIDGVWQNEDVALLRAAGNCAAPTELINPYLLREAIAPHIAAEHKGVAIEIPRIRAACEQLGGLAEIVVVEGVGGFRVPLSTSQDTADLAVALDLPVVLVVGMRLGCLNHALLTAEAIAARRLRLAGWVANRLDPEMPAYDENLAALSSRLGASPLADIAWQAPPDATGISRLFPPKRLDALLRAESAMKKSTPK